MKESSTKYRHMHLIMQKLPSKLLDCWHQHLRLIRPRQLKESTTEVDKASQKKRIISSRVYVLDARRSVRLWQCRLLEPCPQAWLGFTRNSLGMVWHTAFL